MLKRERLLKITEIVNEQGIVTVNDIIQTLNVSDMTVRRDLDELEKAGKLIRIHGGAQSITMPNKKERSNIEKQTVQTKEKWELASYATQLVNDGETIFIGPGTTLECFAEQLKNRQIRIVTNSLPVFNILQDSETIDLILIGGEYRSITGAFVGSLASQNISSLKFAKAFISCNGIYKNDIATYSETEGEIQKLAFNNSIEKYLLVDNQKFNAYDFFIFYHLNNIDAVVTDSQITEDVIERYNQFTQLLVAHENKE
ncbi:TPA: DeoR/GlpR family DNA-binding transcription regulator [Streptococcus pyogenes]|uniref:DeoR/GlpR family DNA-binding transcription regulator n=1 Tax=Streptococcus pyogenes TaxID=1314 RepID=UPI0003C77D03|nr:DeoR/GlpR family DNA-binding transcription regulator [Streptococcus pyogenes]AIG50708.1 DeoR family transcriptional regulator [Streptococcus pyogenes STAB901]HER4511560.1 DeoR/GlpR transcriptional regulator [Streptococcus pyogenes NGAS729]HER4516676.1 DeoR/GlpR transcriptional regulator [Streptococcus pyogenes NGAS732]HER4635157.1 DeoR/GlpR transcriptional regulator [Streptococcus pyogenes NGAS510]HER4684829.1 DeoR/GlpR transcriptional regulator [Streptococcus pyogenes NGAS353]HER4759026.1